MMLSLDTAYRSFGGEVEASSTPTICRLPDSRRHQLSAIAPGRLAQRLPGQARCTASNQLSDTSMLYRLVRSQMPQALPPTKGPVARHQAENIDATVLRDIS